MNDECVRLEKENARLRGALENLCHAQARAPDYRQRAYKAARAALGSPAPSEAPFRLADAARAMPSGVLVTSTPPKPAPSTEPRTPYDDEADAIRTAEEFGWLGPKQVAEAVAAYEASHDELNWIRETLLDYGKAGLDASLDTGKLVFAAIQKYREEAVTAEREACARVAESGHRDEWSPRFIAERIRARRDP